MRDEKIKRGINLPIIGSPSSEITEKIPRHVGINACDFNGVKPSFKVKEGDQISKGQAIYVWKNDPKVAFVSPVSGKLTSISRGARRALQYVEIETMTHLES